MTSQLNVDTIVDKAGSGGTNVKVGNTSTYVSEGGNVTQNTVQGLAKQWVYFDMASTTAVDSLNTSSLTDSGTGKFVVHINNDFNNTSYTVNYTGNGYASDTFPANVTCVAKISYETTTTTGVYDTISYSSALVDSKYNYCTAHGDLA